MLHTTLFARIQESIGFATLCTSTGSFVDSLLLERSTEAFVERGTRITRHDLPEGPLGRGTTPSLCVVTVDLHDHVCDVLLLFTFILGFELYGSILC